MLQPKHRNALFWSGMAVLVLLMVGLTKIDYWWWVGYGRFQVQDRVEVAHVNLRPAPVPDQPLALDFGCVKLQLPFELWWNVEPVMDFGFRAATRELGLISQNIYAELLSSQNAPPFYGELDELLKTSGDDISFYDANEVTKMKIGRLLAKQALLGGQVIKFASRESKGYLVLRDREVNAYVFSRDEMNGFCLTFVNRNHDKSGRAFIREVVAPIICNISYDNATDPLAPPAFHDAVRRL